MKRQIIKIDENKCIGCGLCASACAEGAIQMVDGKARLISEVFCDGLGVCLGECPVDAITIEQREAAPYSERETIERLLPQGVRVVTLHLEHLKNHGQMKWHDEGVAVLREKGIAIPGVTDTPDSPRTPTTTGETMSPPDESKECGCPHATQQALNQAAAPQPAGQPLTNWPIQLQLINPNSDVFDKADLVIAADCTAFSLPDFYKRFTKNKVLVVFCPKLDRANEHYVEKLAMIFSQHDIRSITLLRMQVPCCGGTAMIVGQALRRAGKEIDVVEYTVHFDGTMS